MIPKHKPADLIQITYAVFKKEFRESSITKLNQKRKTININHRAKNDKHKP